MKVTVGKPSELAAHDVAGWRRWQTDDPRLSSPFLAPEFAVAYSRHVDAARIAVLEDGNDTVGYFAFERRRGGVGRSLGYGCCDSQAVICHPDFTWDPTDLLAKSGLAVFEFDHLLGHQTVRWAPRSVSHHTSAVIDLTAGYDAWLATKRKLSPGRTKKALQNERKLERQLGALRFVFDSRSEQDLQQLTRWKGAQYLRTGRRNPFDQPWFLAWVEEMLALRGKHFGLGISRLEAGDRTVALHLSLRGPGVVSGWFPTYDPSLSSYSPGIAYWLQLVRSGEEYGVARIELGPGDAEYKSLFATTADDVAVGIVDRPVPAAYARRLRVAPRRLAIDLVLSNEHLHATARRALRVAGRVRTQAARRH